MFWEEDEKINEKVPDSILDLLFEIRGREIPVDHAYALSTAITSIAPEILEDGRFGVHTIHVAGSQNGWERPDFNTENRLIISRRTKFTLRVPREHASAAEEKLSGAQLDLGGCQITLGKAKERPLSKQGTIFSRYVQSDPDESEMNFLQRIANELKQHDIRIKKAMCGKNVSVYTPDGPIESRSLMLADLLTEETLKLQEVGLGPGRHMGFGIFIPHKGIEAVNKGEEEEK
ncbi:type I-MYXAN CRISPR-associated protein Cas6/Cmx6 [Solemya velum gill symbiont]|uniref:Cas6-like CRISPR-associated protein n=1 Tax=Solemya velum gill symbiont TaxID=2340 RepID=A0A0B0HE57_SOVGS|nr:type I-MYXAN CRISPR-associated protein Cas6/Cmx6 [Solemya velum gill symbiont]KHF26214.1 Cas6-like CRISPR-associated protein [Solemya velum gill symbiont]OOY35928.1 type I-MYXAN CRISPR-associated protein Cas6/Cmx6 [Solemya velum gill symbiont]OOY38769.1 type I-MYXAN CRISPR-associated protein Cas6/Cmx6 [Solemya velum gill symbiont]OOY40697.1 type I-MYXAN CRISPR-associated protein Cas6/Cmx6 [Solemya velum gill symbiont]OOY44528.1 type I-MYXAN CRISPR-associated protein Cas6/Cmx6 [Solemya velum